MTDDMRLNQQTKLLELQNALVKKQWLIAQANNDTSRHGEWKCDYREQMKEINCSIELAASWCQSSGLDVNRLDFTF